MRPSLPEQEAEVFEDFAEKFEFRISEQSGDSHGSDLLDAVADLLIDLDEREQRTQGRRENSA
jgi:hypothetical protein